MEIIMKLKYNLMIRSFFDKRFKSDKINKISYKYSPLHLLLWNSEKKQKNKKIKTKTNVKQD